MTPTLRATARLLTVALGAALLSGCLLSAPHLDPVRLDMEAQIPGLKLEPQIHLHFGRISLGLAKGITRLAMDEGDEEEQALANLMRHVKGVEVAVFETTSLLANGSESWSKYMAKLGERRGWVPAAKIGGDEAATAVFFKFKDDQIRNVYVFTLDDENMVLVRFKGHLDRIIADGLALYGDEIAEGMIDGDLDDELGDEWEEVEEPQEEDEPSVEAIMATSLAVSPTARP